MHCHTMCNTGIYLALAPLDKINYMQIPSHGSSRPFPLRSLPTWMQASNIALNMASSMAAFVLVLTHERLRSPFIHDEAPKMLSCMGIVRHI